MLRLIHYQNFSHVVAMRYVVDGNFTAQHMKMKRLLDNVALADGLAYMVGETQYCNHVSSAPDNKEVSNVLMAQIYRWKSHPFRNQIVRTIVLSMMPTNPT